MGWMLTCREVAEALARAPAERWGMWRRIGIRLHLMMCGDCHRYAAQLNATAAAVRDLCADEMPAADLEESILAAIKQQR